MKCIAEINVKTQRKGLAISVEVCFVAVNKIKLTQYISNMKLNIDLPNTHTHSITTKNRRYTGIFSSTVPKLPL